LCFLDVEGSKEQAPELKKDMRIIVVKTTVQEAMKGTKTTDRACAPPILLPPPGAQVARKPSLILLVGPTGRYTMNP
jgi:hypothetical protein